MKKAVISYFCFIVLACTNNSTEPSENSSFATSAQNSETSTDSIDIYGLSGCIKHSRPDIPSFITALDSMWQILAPFDSLEKKVRKHPIGELKKSLELNDFLVDTFPEGFMA